MAISDETSIQVGERFAPLVTKVTPLSATSTTLGAVDLIESSGVLIVTTNAGATTITIPESTSAGGKQFPIGSNFTVFCKGAGGVTVAKTGSDVLTGTATIAQNTSKKVTKVAATEWVIA